MSLQNSLDSAPKANLWSPLFTSMRRRELARALRLRGASTWQWGPFSFVLTHNLKTMP